MSIHRMCVLLAPVLVSATAFQWSLPEPTIYSPAVDASSPAPTAAPKLLGHELFRRLPSPNDNTCAFVSGLSQSSITCHSNSICATNTYLGIHGCCDPASLSSCNIPTTCIPSTAMSASCTDAACSSNTAIAKCTTPGFKECYQYLIQYSNTVMTQHGCTSSALTLTLQRSWGPLKSSSTDGATTTTTTPAQDPIQAPSLLSQTPLTTTAQPNLGIIVGCTIGGCTFFSIIALLAFLVHRRRRRAKDGYGTSKPPRCPYPTTQYNALSSPTLCSEADGKETPICLNAHPEPVIYPDMDRERTGVLEVDGTQMPVEAPAWSENGR